MNAKRAIELASENKIIIPAFNIPYLPMVKSVISAIIDENSFAMIQVAKVEWKQFESGSMRAVRDEYMKYANEKHTLLHLDHIPVIDEEMMKVDYIPLIKEAIELGYQSVMIDASRLSLDDNIEATAKVAKLAHEANLPCEAELGAVMGHENIQLPPYEEIFASKKGFTNLEEAERFALESGCDWLSVAIGNIHGAVAEAVRHQKKPIAKLDIEHLKKLQEATKMPIVLHGGSGIEQKYILEAMQNGIAKINVGTEIRQAYEETLAQTCNIEAARQAVYERTRFLIKDFYHISNTANIICN